MPWNTGSHNQAVYFWNLRIMYKQVIVVRSDVKMGKGKLAAQTSHASLYAYKKSGFFAKRAWENQGSKKVVLKAKDLNELKRIYERALKAGLPTVMITDAGKTQIQTGTITCVGIGPDKEEKIDKITGELKLL